MLAMLGCGMFAAGCGSPPPQFQRYVTFIRLTEKQAGAEFKFKPEQLQALDEILAAQFGTPNEPSIPALGELDVAKVMRLNNLKTAAGGVGSDASGRAVGLYREHCAHCHGVTGDGMGPTAAFLNPYPRDYRKGQFKFKSTPVGFKPTHEDLTRIIKDGIPGTAMPSFLLLPENEIEAIVEYVKYLAIRGEVERNLLNLYAAGELGAEDKLISNAAEPNPEQVTMLKDQTAGVVTKWLEAEANATGVSVRPNYTPEEFIKSKEAGRALFQGTKANCFSCHGITALGDGQLTGFDEWTKELIAPTGVRNPELIREFTHLGMLEPRNIRPRNLRQGVFRGGRRPLDIFWRVRNGIEGTPMPGFKPEVLSDNDIWNIVNYVQSLAYEPISDPRQARDPINVQDSAK